jgi:hypothetical protein
MKKAGNAVLAKPDNKPVHFYGRVHVVGPTVFWFCA